MRNIILFFTLFSSSLFGNDTTYIETSAQCYSCKYRIESRLHKVKGIISSMLNVDTKRLMVIYDKSIITVETIVTKVTEIGYDANGNPAKPAAYKRLPKCCRKDYKGSHN